MSKTKVLVVEDERLIAENSAIILNRLGYEVGRICSNTKAAQIEIQNNRPDIVLVDILLHGEDDGIAFADSLRHEHDIPFVFVTATSDKTILERAKVTSPYGYIIKPFNEKDLHSNIEMALYKFNTETKIEHLNQMLYTLNDIGHMGDKAVNETDYLNKLCQILTRFPAFQFSWAGLIDSDINLNYETSASQLDLPEGIHPLLSDGTLSRCVRLALENSKVSVAHYPDEACGTCIMKKHFTGKPIINVRIACEDHIYGVLSTVVLPSLASNAEFLRLFAELAHKVGSKFHALATKIQVGQARLALARSEERFQRLTEIAQDMIMVHDLDGRISYFNPSCIGLLGYSVEDIAGKSIESFIAPRSLPEMDERVKERLRGNHETLRYEIFLVSKAGEEIPLEISANPIVEQGKITSFLLIGRDMRERKQQIAQLQQLSRVVEQSPTAILITDPDGLITYINPKFVTMTGYTLDDVVGKFPTLLQTDHDSADFIRELKATTKRGDIWRGEYETQRRNQEKFWVNVTVSGLLSEEGLSSFIAIIEDISEKKQAELELEHSKQSYVGIFNSTSDAIFLLDEEGKFIDVNNGAVEMYGYEREYFKGKTPADLSADGYNDLNELRAANRRAFNGKPQRFEFWGKRKNGKFFPKDVQVNKVHYFGKEILLVTARDISDRKKAEEELHEVAQKAERSEEVKGYFLANMSHEIRTPLTSIVGYIDLIFNRIKRHLSEQDMEYFDIIHRNSDRLTRTVHSIIDLSQIEAGVTTLEMDAIDLTAVVNNIYIDQKVAAHNKQIKFIYHKPAESFWISGDKNILTGAISNLVDNAINYTNEGQVDLFLTAENKNNYLLEIRDTGIGIAEDAIKSIFDSFSQESMGYTKDYQGLGLGLTIAKKNFELHDLRIEVESEKGRGSSFFVRFPVRDADDSVIVPEPAPEIPEIQHSNEVTNTEIETKVEHTRENILIVEDDENAQRLFGLFLKDHYVVYFASTVAQGRDRLNSTPIDLVVTDLSLIGGEDGLALVRWVRKQERFNKMPVIALTAHAFVSDRGKCMDAGCNDFITKPIFRAQLLEIIQQNMVI
ncbi:MAG: PAS domain S-box protein [Candidatus Marinimicrobia bacterium]|nr:PAS domain S-box protein [Candidatus Neomarinimicrobiota bacterium]